MKRGAKTLGHLGIVRSDWCSMSFCNRAVSKVGRHSNQTLASRFTVGVAEGSPSLAFERMRGGEWVVFSDYQLLFQVQVSQHRKERAARQAKRKPFTDMSLSSLYSVLRAESHGLFLECSLCLLHLLQLSNNSVAIVSPEK